MVSVIHAKRWRENSTDLVLLVLFLSLKILDTLSYKDRGQIATMFWRGKLLKWKEIQGSDQESGDTTTSEGKVPVTKFYISMTEIKTGLKCRLSVILSLQQFANIYYFRIITGVVILLL